MFRTRYKPHIIVLCCVVVILLPATWLRHTQSKPFVGTSRGRVDHVKAIPVKLEDGVCSKGQPLFNKTWLQQEFKAFAEVYQQWSGGNYGGTHLSHQFALWAVIRALKPAHIIESGVWAGGGTWILRQAAPEAQLIMMDPLVKDLKYTDKHKDTVYLRGWKFKDFVKVKWETFSIDKSRTLVFFDDHQSGLRRAVEAWRAGFRHIMMDDNRDVTKEDNFGLKAACDHILGNHEKRSLVVKDNFANIVRQLDTLDVMSMDFMFDQVIQSYHEFPFIWKYEGGPSNVVFSHLSGSNITELYGLTNPSAQYSNICYAQLKAHP